ncbi:MAG: ATP-dependent zinc protease family protein [Gemmataceae bacterium]
MLEPSAQTHAADSPPCQPLPIGWKEYLQFTEWDLRRIRVKIDTGARTSALDVVRYELTETAGGELMATLYLALDGRHPGRFTRIHTPVLRTVVVRNTAGIREERPLVETAVKLGPIHKRIRITITNRAKMRYRMILGREALVNDFLVDVRRKYLLKN